MALFDAYPISDTGVMGNDVFTLLQALNAVLHPAQDPLWDFGFLGWRCSCRHKIRTVRMKPKHLHTPWRDLSNSVNC